MQGDPVNFVDPTGLNLGAFNLGLALAGCSFVGYGSNESPMYFCWNGYDPAGGGGGGGGSEAGGGQQQSSENSKSSCAGVVNDLVNKVLDLAGGPMTVGLGRSMAWDAVYGKYGKGSKDPRPLPTDGFKEGLINHGQGSDVYRHIYGAAGAVLIGDYLVVAAGLSGRASQTGWEVLGAQILDDTLSAGSGRKQAEAELLGDYAGMGVGLAMIRGMKERTRPEALREELFKILCDF